MVKYTVHVVIEWFYPSDITPEHRQTGYVILNDTDEDPRLLPSKLLEPVFANLHLGYFAGQANPAEEGHYLEGESDRSVAGAGADHFDHVAAPATIGTKINSPATQSKSTKTAASTANKDTANKDATNKDTASIIDNLIPPTNSVPEQPSVDDKNTASIYNPIPRTKPVSRTARRLHHLPELNPLTAPAASTPPSHELQADHANPTNPALGKFKQVQLAMAQGSFRCANRPANTSAIHTSTTKAKAADVRQRLKL
ncbi:unnamed protein product [Zymoseptoria tritici ST99CH_3D7]|uniref:Uncharacterized protein n=1 Tax=Zymoseptoria tritici (strain ST99CH_3D7) TaxID=1276538 RepID=A0A1X7SA54_ZYMT9|nr:unnamed protein product [Zymoseptoria tritici ST99CH_3D7]